mgnify:CR=1 FL=1
MDVEILVNEKISRENPKSSQRDPEEMPEFLENANSVKMEIIEPELAENGNSRIPINSGNSGLVKIETRADGSQVQTFEILPKSEKAYYEKVKWKLSTELRTGLGYHLGIFTTGIL